MPGNGSRLAADAVVLQVKAIDLVTIGHIIARVVDGENAQPEAALTLFKQKGCEQFEIITIFVGAGGIPGMVGDYHQGQRGIVVGKRRQMFAHGDNLPVVARCPDLQVQW